jgi:TatD DNase family protein
MILVDVHCHLDHLDLKNRLDEILKNAEEAGVKVIITNGINPETNRESLELAKKHNVIKAALGIYPIDALRNEVEEMEYPLKWRGFEVDDELKFIESQKDNIAAVGEIGLDFVDSNEEQKKEQEVVFRRLLELARKIDKPVIVHSRAAELRVVEILEEVGQKKVVMHCFSGRHHLIKRAIKNGWHLSIPCTIVRSEHFQKVVEFSPLSQLLTETDAPLLSPFKGKMNEPAFVAETIKVIAKQKGMDEIEVANAIFQNYQRLFLG